MPDPKKQAVVIIHGMGEQFPMTTIRTFAKAVWSDDADVLDPTLAPERAGQIWSKPDAVTGSLELRRLTTRPSRKDGAYTQAGVRTDFYECYWADLTENTTWNNFKDWFFTLIWRSPFRVPYRVVAVWWILSALTLVIASIGLATAVRLPPDGHKWGIVFWKYYPLHLVSHWHAWELALVSLVFATVAAAFIVPYFGDVARYVRPSPANIGIRRDVRGRALTLLRALHDSGRYDRIIVAAHSLGSIIAYDLIAFLWAERLDKVTLATGSPALKMLREAERCARPLDDRAVPAAEADLTAFRGAQAAFRHELSALSVPEGASEGKPVWLISDLVTFGSPLTHADFLLARDRAELDERIAQRGFPVCPPVSEEAGEAEARLLGYARDSADKPDLFSYVDGRSADETWKIHHAAPYAATRWTNLYDPPRALLFGDVISGPLAPVFGRGIKDIAVTIRARGGLFARVFTHTLYWSEREFHTGPASRHIRKLREAVDLLAKR